MRTSLALALLPLAAALPRDQGCSSATKETAYDYVVVGGGTSGLVVAKRLSEDLSVSVLVIEAGDSVFNNVNVTNPNGYGLAFGTEIDYAYQTVNQTYGGGLIQTMRAGKALGGTSTINGMAYTRAEISQIDAWEQVGNDGWNWDSLFPYYLKSEHFQVPDEERTVAAHLPFDKELHGLNGPLKTGWNYEQTNSSLTSTINSTFKAIGVPYNPDVNGGNMVGFSLYPFTTDSTLHVREDAARAYYFPYQNQTNLKVLLNTKANKITWSQNSKQNAATAEGVEITSSDGTTSVVKANKEVILSAGSLASPLLLELSGIGNPAVLSKYDIETVVDLPTVGENLQDQMNNGLSFNAANGFSLADKTSYIAYPSVSHIYGNETLLVAENIKASLPEYAAQVAAVNGNVTRASDLLEFFQMQWDLIFTSQVPIAEVLVYIVNGVWTTEYWALLPFARGSIHIGSDSTANAVINPNYFMLDWDLQEQAQTARFIRKMYATAPLAGMVLDETRPGLDTVSAAADDAEWAAWLKSAYRSNFHPVGTAAMMPKEKGGVVDANLKVYGTSNVRVIDASVMPFQVCGHLVSTLYAIAERAADLIKKSA
ncbi:GMC oxidoreductase [Pseudomassariella vexata]|uniref:GMC oxidoreductase n=1 Tax=Pseudomassariella vexata TaxID=1141098 RepID=A0A1Y2E825_9PEZI|nr:GMC oxidoreductase [Pseudomassariella vexata]ORY67689.1 GMC oxidoreductase [Pseudomassariella vexata]